MAHQGYTQGTCGRCGKQTLVRRRTMFHTMGALDRAEREMICAACLKRSRLMAVVALMIVVIVGGGAIALPFMI